ncbi:DUF4129 domain-containing protein [Myroides sp. LJL115]
MENKTNHFSCYLYVLLIGFSLHCKAFVLPPTTVLKDTLKVAVPDTLEPNQSSIIALPIKKVNILPLKKEVDSALVSKKFQANFKPKYQRDPLFNYAEQTPSTWSKIKKSIDRFLSSFFKPPEVNSSTFYWLIDVLKVLGVVALVLLGYYVYKAIRQKDIYWLFTKSSKNFQVDLQKIQDNLEATDFQELVQKSVQGQNYTLAIRLYYLWLLQHLEKNNHVVWDKQKTNKDYQKEIKNPKLQQEFTYACYLYDNIWYGQHSIDKAQFDKAEHCFLTLLKTNDYA